MMQKFLPTINIPVISANDGYLALRDQKNHFKLAVTGHRPQKLSNVNEVKKHCFSFLKSLKKFFPNTYLLSGMALGVDQIFFEIGKELDYECIAIIPYLRFGDNWSINDRRHYQDLLRQSLFIVNSTDSNTYNRQHLLDRNKYLVDNSNCLLAYYSGISGGTAHAIEYAKSVKLPTRIFDPKTL